MKLTEKDIKKYGKPDEIKNLFEIKSRKAEILNLNQYSSEPAINDRSNKHDDKFTSNLGRHELIQITDYKSECSNCGFEIDNEIDPKYCSNCGVEFDDSQEYNDEDEIYNDEDVSGLYNKPNNRYNWRN